MNSSLLYGYVIPLIITAPSFATIGYFLGKKETGPRFGIAIAIVMFFISFIPCIPPTILFVGAIVEGIKLINKKVGNWIDKDPNSNKNTMNGAPNIPETPPIPPMSPMFIKKEIEKPVESEKKEEKIDPIENRFEILDL